MTSTRNARADEKLRELANTVIHVEAEEETKRRRYGRRKKPATRKRTPKKASGTTKASYDAERTYSGAVVLCLSFAGPVSLRPRHPHAGALLRGYPTGA